MAFFFASPGDSGRSETSSWLVSSSVLSHTNVSVILSCSLLARVTTQAGSKLGTGSSCCQLQGIYVTKELATTLPPAKSFPRRKSIPSMGSEDVMPTVTGSFT